MRICFKDYDNGIKLLFFTGLLVNYFAYYPGFLSSDGLDQYQQALNGNYGDWHPPIMAAFWRVLTFIIAGPQLMLFYQLGALWLSGYLLSRLSSSSYWKVSIGLLMLAPFIQNFAGYIVKDSQMGLSWLLACSVMLHSKFTRRHLTAAGTLAMLLLFYGMAVRPNAFPGCLPLIYLWLSVYSQWRRIRSRGLAAVSVCLGLLCTQIFVTKAILKPADQKAVHKLYLHDLTGIFKKTGENVFPSALTADQTFDTGYLRREYTTATFDNIWWNNKAIPIADIAVSIDSRDLSRSWLSAIRANTAVYIDNRANGFLYYLRLKQRTTEFYNYFMWIDEGNAYGLKHKPNFFFKGLQRYVEAQRKMVYMLPWFWMLLNVVLLFCSRAVKSSSIRLAYKAMIWSGFLYQLPAIFIFQTDTDFRYFYWNCISCSVAILILLFHKRLARTSGLTPSA